MLISGLKGLKRYFFCVTRFYPITRLQNNGQERLLIFHVSHRNFAALKLKIVFTKRESISKLERNKCAT